METGDRTKLESVPRAAFVVVTNGDRVLFVRHSQGSSNPAGTYGLPGGRIEPNEDSKQAALRELFEETGIVALPPDLAGLGSYSIDIETKNGMESWAVELYLCERFNGEIRQREDSETPAWLEIADILVGRYRMPKMSHEYLSAIMKILRDRSRLL